MRLSPTTRCGFCKSARVVKAGWRYNSSGPKQRFLCKSCGRRFTVDDGFLRMKFRAETITAAIDLFLTSKSLRKARNWLERHWNEFPRSHVSIWMWIQKFSKLVNRFVENLKPNLSEEWHADEMVIFLEGKWHWSWEVMDSRTRFWIASQITKGRDRGVTDAESILAKARRRARSRQKKLVTDGLPAYERGLSWSLGRRYCEHVTEVSWRDGKHKTNLVERKIQTTRMRLKTIRCLKSRKTGENLLDCIRIHYNFVRKHMALGKTPAEAAGWSSSSDEIDGSD